MFGWQKKLGLWSIWTENGVATLICKFLSPLLPFRSLPLFFPLVGSLNMAIRCANVPGLGSMDLERGSSPKGRSLVALILNIGTVGSGLRCEQFLVGQSVCGWNISNFVENEHTKRWLKGYMSCREARAIFHLKNMLPIPKPYRLWVREISNFTKIFSLPLPYTHRLVSRFAALSLPISQSPLHLAPFSLKPTKWNIKPINPRSWYWHSSLKNELTLKII